MPDPTIRDLDEAARNLIRLGLLHESQGEGTDRAVRVWLAPPSSQKRKASRSPSPSGHGRSRSPSRSPSRGGPGPSGTALSAPDADKEKPAIPARKPYQKRLNLCASKKVRTSPLLTSSY